MASFYDEKGELQELKVSIDLAKEASTNSMSMRDWVNSTYPTDASAYGDTFSQLCASEGIILRNDRKNGIKTPSLQAVLSGRPAVEAGSIVRTPSDQARVLLMPAIGALVEDKLVADLDMDATAFDSMLAIDETIADDWLLWPEANYSNPEAARSQGISQLAKPQTMLALTTSEKSVKIPTYALGIEWSEQATKYLSLDFISMSIAREVATERNERANENLLAMLNGDADVGQGALSAISGKIKTAVSLDSTATTGITQKAWMLWLYNNSKKRRITHAVTDILGALAIEGRAGRPTVQNDNNTSPRINAEASPMNPNWGDVTVFITDNANWPAGTVMGIDSRYAMHRVTSTNASYQAQEDFVMRRGSAMRFDYGSITRRLFDDAFEVLTFS